MHTDLSARQVASLAAFYRALATGSPGATATEVAPGVQCAITPACPDRSVVNAVVYERAEEFLAALPAVRDHYANAPSWTVWLRPGDDAVAGALREDGHVLDASPRLMAGVLAEMDLDGPDLDLASPGPWDAVAAINEAAYGLPPGAFAPAFTGLGTNGPLRAWVVVADGEPVSAAVTLRHGDNCHLVFVATRPEAAGRGLGGAVCRLALRRASAEGAATTTLEASRRGEPVYARMGYRTLGVLEMWEKRRR